MTDRDILLADVTAALGATSSVTVTVGATSVGGYFDEADESEVLSIEGVARVYGRVVVVPTGALSGLTRGATITVDDGSAVTSYQVREVRRRNDGLETEVQLVA